jgi:hypothetical protein
MLAYVARMLDQRFTECLLYVCGRDAEPGHALIGGRWWDPKPSSEVRKVG